jgi:hypothetical protein
VEYPPLAEKNTPLAVEKGLPSLWNVPPLLWNTHLESLLKPIQAPSPKRVNHIQKQRLNIEEETVTITRGFKPFSIAVAGGLRGKSGIGGETLQLIGPETFSAPTRLTRSGIPEMRRTTLSPSAVLQVHRQPYIVTHRMKGNHP